MKKQKTQKAKKAKKPRRASNPTRTRKAPKKPAKNPKKSIRDPPRKRASKAQKKDQDFSQEPPNEELQAASKTLKEGFMEKFHKKDTIGIKRQKIIHGEERMMGILKEESKKEKGGMNEVNEGKQKDQKKNDNLDIGKVFKESEKESECTFHPKRSRISTDRDDHMLTKKGKHHPHLSSPSMPHILQKEYSPDRKLLESKEEKKASEDSNNSCSEIVLKITKSTGPTSFPNHPSKPPSSPPNREKSQKVQNFPAERRFSAAEEGELRMLDIQSKRQAIEHLSSEMSQVKSLVQNLVQISRNKEELEYKKACLTQGHYTRLFSEDRKVFVRKNMMTELSFTKKNHSSCEPDLQGLPHSDYISRQDAFKEKSIRTSSRQMVNHYKE
ncbi:unnamed protein product [Moneuplotes crassus]|uniref:Uncharacterized protein n=1 Tax=Euplotes crassus TaxID=5936 RepID=A0AAD1UB00_EUPCR|nr:unnamed protein product [Moneuplotes crassus]